MYHESALTPLLLQAYQIYRHTYGLTPKIFADITIDSTGKFRFQIFPYSFKNVLNITNLFALLCLLPLFVGTILVILKLLYNPTTTNISLLQTTIILLIFSYDFLGLLTYAIFVKHKQILYQINSFITNGFHLGKYIKHIFILH